MAIKDKISQNPNFTTLLCIKANTRPVLLKCSSEGICVAQWVVLVITIIWNILVAIELHVAFMDREWRYTAIAIEITRKYNFPSKIRERWTWCEVILITWQTWGRVWEHMRIVSRYTSSLRTFLYPATKKELWSFTKELSENMSQCREKGTTSTPLKDQESYFGTSRCLQH